MIDENGDYKSKQFGTIKNQRETKTMQCWKFVVTSYNHLVERYK